MRLSRTRTQGANTTARALRSMRRAEPCAALHTRRNVCGDSGDVDAVDLVEIFCYFLFGPFRVGAKQKVVVWQLGCCSAHESERHLREKYQVRLGWHVVWPRIY